MRRSARRVLAIDPNTRGFGYVVLEDPNTLIDWGVKSARSGKATVLSNLRDFIRQYRPYALVIEDADGKGSRRCKRVRRLLKTIRAMAKKSGVKTKAISLTKVKEVFAAFGARTKHEIAQVVAKQLPELASKLPPRRKPWMNEDYHMATFDAAALALAGLHTRRPVRSGNG